MTQCDADPIAAAHGPQLGEAVLSAVIECIAQLGGTPETAPDESSFIERVCASLTADGRFASARVELEDEAAAVEPSSARPLLGFAFRLRSGERGSLSVIPVDGSSLDDRERELLGAVAGTIGVGLDAVRNQADRLRLEEAVSESEERYWRLVEISPDPIVVTVADTLVYANDAAVALSGASSVDQIVGRPALDFVHPTHRDWSGERMRRLDKGQQVQPRAEMAVSRVDGTSVEVELTSVPCLFRGQRAIQSILRDLSEQKRRQAALEESEERYRTIIEAAHDMVWILDREGRFAYANMRSGQVVGHRVADWIGRSFSPLVVAEDLPRVVERFQKVLVGQPQEDEIRVTARDGRRLTLSVNTTPLVRGGVVVGAVCFARDITEQRLLEGRLLRAQKMENLGRLAGGIAHDFNNLLAAIQGYGELLLSSPDLPPSLHPDALEVKAAAERGVALTRQLLAFSRQQALRPVVVSLNSVVEGMESLLRRVLGEDVEYVIDLAPDLWPVTADAGQLEQVLMNLAVNARDAMPSGGRLLISTANQVLCADHELTHLEVLPGGFAVLTVEDSGLGMDPETLSLAFEPFFTTKGSGRGTGLGLSTVYGVVKQSGGGIWVDSRPGEGTTFRLYLPRSSTDVPRPSDPMPGTEAGGSGDGETVLLVEDDGTVRDLVRRILRGLGYSVLEAASAEDALSALMALEDPIDLLLTDVVLPGMNGRELAAMLHEQYPDLPAVLMSGYAAEVLTAADVTPGAQSLPISFIEKPFSPDVLAHTVRRALDGVGAS